MAKLCLTLVTPWTAAHQAPLSIGFCRQTYWSGVTQSILIIQRLVSVKNALTAGHSKKILWIFYYSSLFFLKPIRSWLPNVMWTSFLHYELGDRFLTSLIFVSVCIVQIALNILISSFSAPDPIQEHILYEIFPMSSLVYFIHVLIKTEISVPEHNKNFPPSFSLAMKSQWSPSFPW